MNLGVLIDTVVFIGLGICVIYLADAKKKALGNKSKWLKIGGVIIILSKVLEIIFFRK